MDVVGTMFFENKKLLIDKPRKRSTFQMIGGKIESFLWYGSSYGNEILSNILKNEVVPYCILNKLIN